MGVVRGRGLSAGTAVGWVLVLGEALSLWGGADAGTGVITDERHPQWGETLSGRVVVMPGSRGSSSSASVLAEMLRVGVGPAAIVAPRADAILVIGALVAEELYGLGIPIVELDAEELRVLAGWSRVAVSASDADAEITEVPDVEIAEMSNAEIAKMPDAETTEMPSVEIAEMPSAAIAEMPDGEVL